MHLDMKIIIPLKMELKHYWQIVKNIKIEKIINEMETFAGLEKENSGEKFNTSQINKKSALQKRGAFMPASLGYLLIKYP